MWSHLEWPNACRPFCARRTRRHDRTPAIRLFQHHIRQRTNVGSIKINFDTVCTLPHPPLFTLPSPRVSRNSAPMSVAVRFHQAPTTKLSSLPHRPCSTASLSRSRRRWAGSVCEARSYSCLKRRRCSSLWYDSRCM